MVESHARSRSPRRSTPPANRRERSRSNSRERQRRRSSSPLKEAEAKPAAPQDKSRSHSRSPPRGPRKTNHSKGFKWKSQPSRDSDADRDGRDYRDRERDRDRSFQPRRYGGGRDERERDRGGDRRRDGGYDRKNEDRFGGGRDRDSSRKESNKRDEQSLGSKAEKSNKPPPRAAAVAAASQTYIIVTVNDRLGTKANIPCLASDTVGDFKKMVAAMIGRQPHEIMLKRQGERPFKDMLTLEDYGVSSGVQLDLELDTGD